MEIKRDLYSLLQGEGEEYPLIDYRDSNEVWIWVSEMVLITMTRSEVEALLEGFDQNEAEEGDMIQ